MGLEIKRFSWNYLNSNMYVIRDGETTVVIDPIDTVELDLSGATVFLTHEHFDHINGLNKIRSGCAVIDQCNCSERIQNERNNLSVYAETMHKLAGKEVGRGIESFTCSKADVEFEDVLEILIGNHSYRCIHTPGHSPGSMCIVMDNRLLFSGDTLLEQGPMSRFPGGDPKAFRACTVPKLLEIMKTIETVYPGHGRAFQIHNAKNKLWLF